MCVYRRGLSAMFTDMDYELEEDKLWVTDAFGLTVFSLLMFDHITFWFWAEGSQQYLVPCVWRKTPRTWLASALVVGLSTVPAFTSSRYRAFITAVCSNVLCHDVSDTVLLWPLVLQVFDNTPAALDGTLAAGDEITGVNGKPVKGKTKVEVAKMIQAVQVQSNTHRTCWRCFHPLTYFVTHIDH